MIASPRLDRFEDLLRSELRNLEKFAYGSGNELVALRLDEIQSSAYLAGVAMNGEDVAALALRGIASGDRRLDDFILVADYAHAATYVWDAVTRRARRRLIAVEEIVEIHARALARARDARPGTWRTQTVRAFASGMVAPPAWLVPREVGAFVDRFGSGPQPDESPLLWVATALERFLRIQPFERGNGRVGRLVTNLLLRRLDLPPFFVIARERARYALALRAADARDHEPLARLLGRSLLTNARRLLAAADRDDTLVPLSQLVAPHERHGLYKAAQRGRLRTVRRGGTLYTTAANIDAYRASRSPAGRR